MAASAVLENTMKSLKIAGFVLALTLATAAVSMAGNSPMIAMAAPAPSISQAKPSDAQQKAFDRAHRLMESRPEEFCPSCTPPCPPICP